MLCVNKTTHLLGTKQKTVFRRSQLIISRLLEESRIGIFLDMLFFLNPKAVFLTNKEGNLISIKFGLDALWVLTSSVFNGETSL